MVTVRTPWDAQEAEVRLRERFTRRLLSRAERKKDGRFEDSPVGFIQTRLASNLWSKQIEICESVAANRHTAVHSCHGVGKSFVAARLIAWWITTHGIDDSFVISTAPTFAQVRAILWRELRDAWQVGNLGGKMNQTEWWLENRLVAMGRKPSDYDTNAFQGIHARNVLAVIDEAAGVPSSIWTAVETIVTNETSRVLAIGNPDDPSSRFAEVCRPGNDWNTIHIDAFESPAYTGEEVSVDMMEKLVSPLWVEERRREWGEGSPLWESRVRGKFPVDAEETVVPLSWIRNCQYDDSEREPLEAEVDEGGNEGRQYSVALGVDVGAGGDETTVCLKQGRRAIMANDWRGRTPDPNQALGIIMKVAKTYEPDLINVDANGIGWALCELIRRELSTAGLKATVNPVQVGERATQPDRFPRKRDELWWAIGRENTQRQEWDLTDIPDLALGQLTAPKYDLDSQGRVRVEPKAETKRRLGRSPDLADALLLAFHAAPSLANSVHF